MRRSSQLCFLSSPQPRRAKNILHHHQNCSIDARRDFSPTWTSLCMKFIAKNANKQPHLLRHLSLLNFWSISGSTHSNTARECHDGNEILHTGTLQPGHIESLTMKIVGKLCTRSIKWDDEKFINPTMMVLESSIFRAAFYLCAFFVLEFFSPFKKTAARDGKNWIKPFFDDKTSRHLKKKRLNSRNVFF